MDIDCLQLKLKRYHRDLLLVPLMNVFEVHLYIVHVYAIWHDDFETKPKEIIFYIDFRLHNIILEDE